MFSINFIIFFYNNLLSFKSIYTMLLYLDRKSTRLNSSHANISYAVFCLKKKNGDMSIVGTRQIRPAFFEELCETSPKYWKRLAGRPGLTGFAHMRIT